MRYATAPSPLGPLDIPRDNLVIAKEPSTGIYATGHNSVVQIPGRDEWYIVYHRFTYPDGISMGPDAGYQSGGLHRSAGIRGRWFHPENKTYSRRHHACRDPMKKTVPGIFSMSLDSTTPLSAETETAHPFPLSHVHLLPGPFKDRERINARYLLEVVEPDRLLAGFRTQAGLASKAERYGGWEARGITGHSLGHYLSALSALAASSDDEAVRGLARERIDYIVSELAECQRANGDGYVLPVDKRVYDELRREKSRLRASA